MNSEAGERSEGVPADFLAWALRGVPREDEETRALLAGAFAALGDARGDASAHRQAMALASRVFAWQRTRCAAVDRVARAFGAGEGVGEGDPLAAVDRVPGVPTDVFKSARVACFDSSHETRVFRTSGTTREVRGAHPFATLAFYDRAACAAGARWLLPQERYRFVLLAPGPDEVSDSSLGYMLELFASRWGDGPVTWGVSKGSVALDAVKNALDRAREERVPVALLGATFAFVHAHDALEKDRRWTLPAGSVAMPTGGFKGRSRELPQEDLFALLGERFGLDRSNVVQEYGMTELSSQCYEAQHVGEGAAGRYYAPPWVRVRAVDPETLEVLPAGERGLIKVIDLANVGSCVAIQTADLGVVHEDGGFEVHGRAPGATPRGCARAIDAVLSGDG